VNGEEMRLGGKEIVLGVTGSIAAYKAVELLRELVKAGASVKVVMTESARRFVAPLTFATLSRQEVMTDLFTLDYDAKIRHIAATEGADLLLVAPATANVIGKFARGLADDLLTNLFLASTRPVLLAPAMDADMYRHPAVQENLERLRAWGGCSVGRAGARGAPPAARPGAGAERSGPLPAEPLVRQDGLRHCPRGVGSRRPNNPGERSDGPDGAQRSRGDSGGNSPADARGDA